MDTALYTLSLLIILSGFFSGAEIALISMTPAQIRAMVKKGNKSAHIIEKIKKNPQKLLITILIGNNLVNIGASVIATTWTTAQFGNKFLGIATGILTLIVLIFGEIIPKTLAERFSSRFALLVAYPLFYLQIILFPIVWGLEKSMNILIKAIGGTKKKITEDEVKAMLSVSAEEGAIENEEKEIINNVMEFDEIRVFQVMTPRAKIFALDQKTKLTDGINLIIEEGHSRIPIYNNNLDKIIGVLTIQEILKAKNNQIKYIHEIDLKKPIFIPETKYLNELFKEFQWKHQHMAIVLNEHGSITGLITMEDLLEEIVGEITDESDDTDTMIEKISESSWRVSSETTIEELNASLKTTFDCDEHKSLSYLLLEKFQKIPRRGEDIKINGFHFFIEKMDNNKIISVRIVKPQNQ